MLRKEIRDVLIQSAWFSATVVAIPAFLTLFLEEPFFDIFFPAFQFGLLFWALFLGNFLFFLERGQGGLEYMFSLPYSRLQLVGKKILPRTVAAALFFVIHLIIYNNGGENAAAFPLLILSLCFVSLFVIGFSLCAVSENFVVSSLAAGISFLIMGDLAYSALRLGIMLKGFELRGFFDIAEGYSPGYFFLCLSVLVLLAAFPLAFFLSARHLDIRPAARFNWVFLKRLGGLLPAVFIISTLITFLGFKEFFVSYYLTRSHQLIESRGNRVRIFNGETFRDLERVRPVFSFFYAIEADGRLFIEAGLEDKPYPGNIIAIDLENGAVKPLYNNEIGIRHGFWKDGRELLALEKAGRQEGLVLARIDIDTGEVIRLPIEHPSLSDLPQNMGYRFLLIGADSLEGRRFWLLASERPWKHPLLQVWEDGAVSDLGIFPRMPQLLNHLLFVPREDRVDIYRISEQGLEPAETFPGELMRLWPLPRDLARPVRRLFGKLHGNQPVMLDLDDFSWTPMEGSPDRIFSNDYGDFYLSERSDGVVKFWIWKNGTFQFIQKIPGGNPDSIEGKRVRFRGNGIMLRYKGRLKVYGFPDLKELIFKGLKQR